MDTTTPTTTTPAPEQATGARDERVLLPPVDVIEDAGGITLYADMPGTTRERLAVHVEGDTLSIEGELDLAVPPAMEPTHAEVQVARYRRAFTLSKELDASKIDATLTQGVLRLRIPKADHAQLRRIAVQAG